MFTIVLGITMFCAIITDIFEAFPKFHFLSDSLGGVELSDQPPFLGTCLQDQMEEENPAPFPPALSHGKKYLED